MANQIFHTGTEDDEKILFENSVAGASNKESTDSTLSAGAVEELRKMVMLLQHNLLKIQKILSGEKYSENEILPSIEEIQERLSTISNDSFDTEIKGKIIEGVFDGQSMIGANGNKYNVPPNYASKSKLVEGDLLKLTIGEGGNFIYKQIIPIDRDRLVGILNKDLENDDFFVEVDHDIYKVLSASVTYFKGDPGDEAVILKPKGYKSKWAALENIVKRS